jgi:hypothetical protein
VRLLLLAAAAATQVHPSIPRNTRGGGRERKRRRKKNKRVTCTFCLIHLQLLPQQLPRPPAQPTTCACASVAGG